MSGAIILLIVTWAYNSPPDVQAYVVKDYATCTKMAAAFVEAEESANDANPYPIREHYAVSCESKNGNDMESP